MSTRQTQSPGRRASNLFEGVGVLNPLVESSYGRFCNAMANVSSQINDSTLSIGRFELPQVIVIGSESSGKSSLLENITKCPVFPRSAGICTKCPIVLKLIEQLQVLRVSLCNLVELFANLLMQIKFYQLFKLRWTNLGKIKLLSKN